MRVAALDERASDGPGGLGPAGGGGMGGGTLEELWRRGSIGGGAGAGVGGPDGDADPDPDRVPDAVRGPADPRDALAADLWRRARRAVAARQAAAADRAGSASLVVPLAGPAALRAYGRSEDSFALGLTLLHLCLAPFSPPDSGADTATLDRLLGEGGPFWGDVEGFRGYAEAEDRWADGVAWLESGDKGQTGWDLAGALLSADWASRPEARAVAKHPFLSG